jgi:putative transposase
MFRYPYHFRTFRKYLAAACLDHGCHVHAYVLMSNHVHLVMSPESPDGIGRVVQAVGRRYVPFFNRSTGRTGALWEGRYRATVIDTEAYLLACYRYVELNPVRAGMVLSAGDYPWSSYRANALGYEDTLVTPHERFITLGREAYRDLVDFPLDNSTLEEIRAASHRGWALGPVVSPRRERPLPQGRHPKTRMKGV